MTLWRFSPASARRLGWLTAIVVWMALAGVCLWKYYPPLAAHQRFTLELPQLVPGTAEPLVVTGETGAGDFFYVKYLDADHVAIGYDSWGSGGPVSPPVKVVPGARHTLDVVLRSLTAARGNVFPSEERLVVVFDGQPLIDAAVEVHLHKRTRVWFAQNPIGGSSCDAEFHGTLRSADGRILHGNVRTVLGRRDRIAGWVRFSGWQIASITLLSVLAGWFVGRAAAATTRPAPPSWASLSAHVRDHRGFVWSATACALLFAWLVTCGSWKFLYEDSFGNFYDFQAQSFLRGHLDVPGEALSGEAFIAHGKVYGYFGITPALLRLPFAALGVCFGELTRPALFVAYCGTLLGAYLLLIQAFRSRDPKAKPGSLITTLFALCVGLGSTIFFLGSRAYVYHEAIAWGVMFAVWGCWFALRQLVDPERRHWIAALACGVLSVHARPPSGLYALTLLGVVAAILLLRHRREVRAVARYALIGAASVLGVLSFNGMSYLKFGTIEGCPLRMNVQYTPERLARIDGKQFHAVNIPFVFATYFAVPGIQTTREFPWIAFKGAKLRPLKAMAKMDMTEPTASVPAAMSGLSFLAVVGGIVALAVGCALVPLASVWLAALPLTIAMCAAIATSQRYTGDFVPFLISAGAIGAAVLARTPSRLRRPLLALGIGATVWSAAVMLALTLRFQGEMGWGQPDGVQLKYQQWRDRIDRWVSPTAR